MGVFDGGSQQSCDIHNAGSTEFVGDAATPQERIARMAQGSTCAGAVTSADIDALAELSVDALDSRMLRRIADLWRCDLHRLRTAEEEKRSLQSALALSQEELMRLETKVAALSRDAALNEAELTREIVLLSQQLQSAEKPVEAPSPCKPDVSRKPEFAAVSGSANEAGASDSRLVALQGGTWPAYRPLVSVVITSFNYGDFINEAIASVLDQTFRDLEIIVVEGGSSDGASRLRVAGLDRSRVRVLMQGSARRVGENRNYGISQAQGKYICCLDADDKLRPTYLEKAVFLLERHDFDVVSSALEMFGEQHGVRHILERPDLAELLNGNQVLTCAVFRRELWERAGGFHDVDKEAIGHVHEDWAFWVRLAAIGARFVNLSFDPLLLYRVHRESLSRGKNVLPTDRQRQLVRMLNADVITPSSIDRSRRRAAARLATPTCALPEISLCSAGDAKAARHAPTLLLAMPYLVLGGAERLLSALVGHLTGIGWRVVIITSIATDSEQGDSTGWFEQYTSEIYHLPRCYSREYWDDFLHHIVESRKVDILWVAGSAFAYDNLRALRRQFPELRVVDILFNTVGHVENNRRRRHLIDLIFVENEEVRGWLLTRNETEGRIRLLKSGVRLNHFFPGLRCEAFRDHITGANDEIVVGFCGRWSPEKDPLTFIEIARRAKRSWPVRFIMTGTGPLKPEILRAIKAARFPCNRFHLLGEVPDIAKVLASLDLLIAPSRLDGRPQVVLEALAAGTPVLASNVGDLPNLIEPGETGWLAEPGDVGGFVECLAKIVANRADLSRHRRAARAYAEAHLNERDMCTAYEQSLLSILPKRALKPTRVGHSFATTELQSWR